jgi:hypothetical protein
LTFLDSEHVVAFAIGVVVVRQPSARIAVSIRRAVTVGLAALHS